MFVSTQYGVGNVLVRKCLVEIKRPSGKIGAFGDAAAVRENNPTMFPDVRYSYFWTDFDLLIKFM